MTPIGGSFNFLEQLPEEPELEEVDSAHPLVEQGGLHRANLELQHGLLEFLTADIDFELPESPAG